MHKNYHNNNKKCKEQKGDSVKYIMKKKGYIRDINICIYLMR